MEGNRWLKLSQAVMNRSDTDGYTSDSIQITNVLGEIIIVRDKRSYLRSREEVDYRQYSLSIY